MEIFRIFGSVFMKTDEADKSLDKMNKKGKKSASMFDGLGAKAGAFALTAGAAIGAVAATIGIKAVGATEDLNKAMNGLQTQTGATNEEIEGMKKSLLNIYKNNFGESFEDIGDSMAYVAQTTGQTGEELEKTTQNALMLRDTFDFEVNESVNAANSLVEHFGITSDRAFELMAIGAQNGANKNGDLLDVLNEYAPAFKNLGLEADDFTQILINGAESGAFSIDKVGDAVKEFEIRTKDLSDGSAEAFESLGLNASAMFEAFAEGGGAATTATLDVLQGLSEMEDPLKQNTAGVALFGTMFEDLGPGIVDTLMQINGEVANTTGVLEEINAIKYDTFSEAMTGIGRQIEVGVLIPLGEMMMPLLNKFANFIQENMPAIEAFIATAMKNIKIAFDIVWGFIKTNVLPLFDQMKDSVNDNFSNIKKTIEEVVKFVVDKVLPVWIKYFEFIKDELIPAVVGTIMEWWPLIADIIEEVWGLVKIYIDLWVKYFEFVWPYIKDTVMWAIDKIKGIITGLLKVLKGVIQFISGVFAGDWEKAWEGIKNIFVGVVNIIESIFLDLISWLTKKIEWVLEKVEAVKNAAKKVGGGIASGARAVGDFVSAPFSGGRASGGPVSSGRQYLIGEEGPELFMPTTSGSIIPNGKLGGGASVVINNPLLLDQNGIDLIMEQMTDRLDMLGVT